MRGIGGEVHERALRIGVDGKVGVVRHALTMNDGVFFSLTTRRSENTTRRVAEGAEHGSEGTCLQAMRSKVSRLPTRNRRATNRPGRLAVDRSTLDPQWMVPEPAPTAPVRFTLAVGNSAETPGLDTGPA